MSPKTDHDAKTEAPLADTILSATIVDDPTRSRIEAALGQFDLNWLEARDGLATLRVEREELHGVIQALRDKAGFESVTLVTAIDHLPQSPRFEVLHQLLSLKHADRVRLRTRLEDREPALDSIVDLFPGAGFMERECFDMFGIDFAGHPDLRRLLMPDGYGHNPLRKDFPHQGIEPDRLYREWDAKRREHWQSDAPEESAHETGDKTGDDAGR